MPRALFEKTGNAVWISHLDLMRVFQRAFKRAGLPLTHTQGYNPRPSVSIALPLSVGVESSCELLDFELYTQTDCAQIMEKLNSALVSGVRVLDVYENGSKLKNLALLDCVVELEYDGGVPEGAGERILDLFSRDALFVEKKGKNGVTEQDIIPMIKNLTLSALDDNTLAIHARICCQNPTLNPVQLTAAIAGYLPELRPDHSKCRRVEIYDADGNIFR